MGSCRHLCLQVLPVHCIFSSLNLGVDRLKCQVLKRRSGGIKVRQFKHQNHTFDLRGLLLTIGSSPSLHFLTHPYKSFILLFSIVSFVSINLGLTSRIRTRSCYPSLPTEENTVETNPQRRPLGSISSV